MKELNNKQKEELENAIRKDIIFNKYIDFIDFTFINKKCNIITIILTVSNIYGFDLRKLTKETGFKILNIGNNLSHNLLIKLYKD